MASISGPNFANINAQFKEGLAKADGAVAQNLRNTSGQTAIMRKNTGPKSKGPGAEESTLSEAAQNRIKSDTEHHAEFVGEHGHELAQQAGVHHDAETSDRTETRTRGGYEGGHETLGEGDAPPGFVQAKTNEGNPYLLAQADNDKITLKDHPDHAEEILADIPETNYVKAAEHVDNQLVQGASKVATLQITPEVAAATEKMELQPAPMAAAVMDIVGPGSDKTTRALTPDFPPEMERVAAENAAAKLASGAEIQEMHIAGSGQPAMELHHSSQAPEPSRVASNSERSWVDEKGQKHQTFGEAGETVVSSADGRVRQHVSDTGASTTFIDHQGKTIDVQVPPGATRVYLPNTDGTTRTVEVPVSNTNASEGPSYLNQAGQTQQPVAPGFLQRLRYAFTGNPNHLGPTPPPIGLAPSPMPAGYWPGGTPFVAPSPFYGSPPPMGIYYNRQPWQPDPNSFIPPVWPPVQPQPPQQAPFWAQPSVSPGQLRNDPTPTRPGSVVILDNFSKPNEHGDLVNSSLNGMPVAGQIAGKQMKMDGFPNEAVGWVNQPHPEATPEQARANLKRGLIEKNRFVLDTNTSQLNQIKNDGLHHSAVNLSQGIGPASDITTMFTHFLESPDKPEAKVALSNYCRAFHLDQEKLYHQDPAVRDPERLKFKQAVAEFCVDAFKDPAIAASKQRYDQAVEDLSKQKVSVVVAAGNEGSLKKLYDDSKKAPVKLPPGAFENALANQHTVTVGASCEKGSKLCEFSSPDSRTSILADGEVAVGRDSSKWGTSFAAPRVALALADIHAKHPDLSNEQALEMLKNKACDAVPGQTVPNLNLDKFKTIMGDLPPAQATPSVAPGVTNFNGAAAEQQARLDEARMAAQNGGHLNQRGQIQQPVPPGFMQRLRYMFTGDPAHLNPPSWGPPCPPWMQAQPYPSNFYPCSNPPSLGSQFLQGMAFTGMAMCPWMPLAGFYNMQMISNPILPPGGPYGMPPQTYGPGFRPPNFGPPMTNYPFR